MFMGAELGADIQGGWFAIAPLARGHGAMLATAPASGRRDMLLFNCFTFSELHSHGCVLSSRSTDSGTSRPSIEVKQ